MRTLVGDPSRIITGINPPVTAKGLATLFVLRGNLGEFPVSIAFTKNGQCGTNDRIGTQEINDNSFTYTFEATGNYSLCYSDDGIVFVRQTFPGVWVNVQGNSWPRCKPSSLLSLFIYFNVFFYPSHPPLLYPSTTLPSGFNDAQGNNWLRFNPSSLFLSLCLYLLHLFSYPSLYPSLFI